MDTEEPLCRLEPGPDWNPPSHWVSSEQKGSRALRPKYKMSCRLLLLSLTD